MNIRSLEALLDFLEPPSKSSRWSFSHHVIETRSARPCQRSQIRLRLERLRWAQRDSGYIGKAIVEFCCWVHAAVGVDSHRCVSAIGDVERTVRREREVARAGDTLGDGLERLALADVKCVDEIVKIVRYIDGRGAVECEGVGLGTVWEQVRQFSGLRRVGCVPIDGRYKGSDRVETVFSVDGDSVKAVQGDRQRRLPAAVRILNDSVS